MSLQQFGHSHLFGDAAVPLEKREQSFDLNIQTVTGGSENDDNDYINIIIINFYLKRSLGRKE